MEIKSVFDSAFIPYGKVVENLDTAELLSELEKIPCPPDRVAYVADEPVLKALPVEKELRQRCFGGMPIQVGYCCGFNKKLDCLEYHRDSEINIFTTEGILMVASQQKIRNNQIDTSEVEAFLVPKGAAVEFYGTTLHYAPCCPEGSDHFCCSVVLPKGTNEDRDPDFVPKGEEDKLLWGKNKWLLAHPDAPEAAQGAFVGVTGENIILP